jgi:hypothetical protein
MINVIENFISDEYQNYLEEKIVTGNLPLYYNEATCIYGSPGTTDKFVNTKEMMQFTHTFIRDHERTSDFLNLIEPINFHFMAKTGVGCNMRLKAIKLNFNPQTNEYNSEQHFTPHIDMAGEEGITAIYYVNDADGDTLFFDKEGNVTQKISPKKGTMVYFDNKVWHAGQPPKSSKFRSIINFNWVK